MQSSPRALGCLVLLLGLTLFASAASGTSPARTKAGCPTSLAPDAKAAAGVTSLERCHLTGLLVGVEPERSVRPSVRTHKIPSPTASTKKTLLAASSVNGPARIRTWDRRIMSPLL